MESIHCTGFGTCSYSPCRASAPVRTSRACQLLINGTTRSEKAVASKSAASRSCAGFIRGQWNGALTGSTMARLAPADLASSTAIDSGRVSGDHDLVGRVQIGGGNHLALRGFPQDGVQRALW